MGPAQSCNDYTALQNQTIIVSYDTLGNKNSLNTLKKITISQYFPSTTSDAYIDIFLIRRQLPFLSMLGSRGGQRQTNPNIGLG